MLGSRCTEIGRALKSSGRTDESATKVWGTFNILSTSAGLPALPHVTIVVPAGFTGEAVSEGVRSLPSLSLWRRYSHRKA